MNLLLSTPLIPKHCCLKGSEDIELRQLEKKNHREKWKYVGAEIECFPPKPSNYSHLPAFTETFLGSEGGIDWVRGLEELEELKNKLEE